MEPRIAEASADVRAREVEAQMTDEERFSLLRSLMVVVFGGGRDPRVPADVPQIAGWVPGVARLGVPPLLITDGPLGITNPAGGRPGDTGTTLPSGLALGSTFNLELARESGALLGREARAKGFNVLCGGGITLVRDLHCGRNFEYISEDPWHSAVIGAETVIGTQAEGVVSMLKHLSLNSNETNKFWLDAVIDPDAHRESDLLAFQIAIEQAEPGSLMCAYNMVNGAYASENATLNSEVIKDAIGFKGWIMSDWRAVYGWEAALAGLDQQSGAQLDEQEWFDEPLKAAYADGRLPKERLSEMVRRILRSVFAVGADTWDPAPEVDMAAHHAAALEGSRQGIVVLKNEGVLPLAATTASVAVIGGHAHLGVLAGGGSSLAIPPAGYALRIPYGGNSLLSSLRVETYLPSSPLAELKRLLPETQIVFDPGAYVADAVLAARAADVAIVFATKFDTEGADDPDLTLPFGQDAVIEAVAAANPNTIVVLETGNPVEMPWEPRVRAIVEAWYPGQAGGQAIAEVLTGVVNPSGRLPVTFPMSISQIPRPELPGYGEPYGTPNTIRYEEGAEVGYRWFAKTGQQPLYPYGHGLSYTSFDYADLEVSGGETVSATFTVTNTGQRAGADVPQLYLTDAPDGPRMRLLGFERFELGPGESRNVSVTADPRLLARFDGGRGQWSVAGGPHQVAVGRSATDLALRASADIAERLFGS